MISQEFSGWISLRSYAEEDDILFIEEDEPLAETLEFMHRKNVTLRFWVADQECTADQANEEFMTVMMGGAEARLQAHYSEYTGYLWTDEELKVGGHDLLEILKSHIGKYLILQVEVYP